MKIDVELLQQACIGPPGPLAHAAPALQAAAQRFDLLRVRTLAAWIATLAHESGNFRYTRELASGEQYEGRLDLGNVRHGDGVLFPGRGYGQITGRSNTEACARHFGLPVDDALFEWLERPAGAALSAGWYFTVWRPRCVDAAEAGDFLQVCRLVAGDPPNGLGSRVQRMVRTLEFVAAREAM